MFRNTDTRCRFSKSDILTILVGKDGNAEEYAVHKSYMVKSSDFMKAALSRDWKETRDHHVTIPDHEPAAFEGYINWVYSDKITFKVEGCADCQSLSRATTCLQAHSLALAKMWILGDYLDDKHFCNAVNDLLKSAGLRGACYLPTETVQHVWQNAPSEGPLRDLLLEIWKFDLQLVSRESLLKIGLPNDFLVELLIYTADNLPEGSQFGYDGYMKKESLLRMACSFHKSVTDERCCAYDHLTY